MVSLRPITDANREAVEAPAVTPDQGRFVSGVRESMLEAEQEPDARALHRAISAEETPVGFVMIADEVGSPVTFYERYGFKRTGAFHGSEILLRLEIGNVV